MYVNLGGKDMLKVKSLNWYNVNLTQFKKLQEVLSIEDETEKIIAIAELILGDDVTDLPLKEFNEEIKKLEFLKTEIPESVPPKKLEINGRKYDVISLLGNITTAQYIDFVNHSKTQDMSKVLSVFIVPQGHSYNDGYDMLEVMNDINDMPIPVVNSMAYFFKAQFAKFIEIFQSSSIKKVKKNKELSKDEKEKIIKLIKESVDLVSFPIL